MRKRVFLSVVTALASCATFPVVALAKAPSLPTCTAASLGAAVQAIVPKTLPGTLTPGNTSATFVNVIPAAPEQAANPPREPTPIGVTPSYCQVAFTYSTGATGPNATVKPSATNPGVPFPAYNNGETQQIQIVIALPLSAADGGSGGVEGNWNGSVMTSGGAGNSGGLGWANFAEGLDHDTGPVYAIRLGYVGSETDDGEAAAATATAGGGTNFAIISDGGSLNNKLAYGPNADWLYRGTHYGQQWANAIAEVYYGKKPKYHYYNGCSGGGNMGMGQLQQYGNDYDGFLIAAPANHWQQFRQGDSWPALVIRKLVQLDGTGALPTSGQAAAVQAAVYAACDVEGTDAVADGIIADPRLCTLNFTATSLICGATGAPASPNCLTSDQAQAYDRIYDGPRNKFGKRTYYPFDVDISEAPGVGLSGSTVQVVQWNHQNSSYPANNCLFVDQESLSLGTTNLTTLGVSACASPGTAMTDEDERTFGSNGIQVYTENQDFKLTLATQNRPTPAKVIHLHGTADGAIRWRQDLDFYNRVAVWFGGTTTVKGVTLPNYAKVQEFYRYFMQPSVGHCTGGLGGGQGVSAYDPFLVLRDWVEKGIKPKQIMGLAAGNAVEPGRTRPLCPFPQTAIYSGEGSTDDISSWTCGGNLQTLPVACNDVKTPFGQENTNNLDFKGVGMTAAECSSYLPPPNAGTPTSP